MFLAKVKRRVVSTIKHEAYKNKHVYVVKTVKPNGEELEEEWVAMDYIEANIGDIVVCGGAPGVAAEVFDLDMAPIETLIMARVDHIEEKQDAN